MSASPAALSFALRPARPTGRALSIAATAWCVAAVLGQLMFGVYVVGFYGRTLAAGQPELWNKVLPHGYAPGATLANLVMGTHLLLTVIVVVGGALQLMPSLRRTVPAFHRWNGRVYIVCALLLAIGGLGMVWTRGTVGGAAQHVAISINGLLLIAFAGMAWREALARRIDAHRRWALRLWIAVAGVWFFRIGLMAWIVANRGPAGFDPKTFQGPFLSFLAFAQFVIPLLVLELYFRVKQRGGAQAQAALATGLGLLTLLTAASIAAATMLMWMPRL